MVKLIKIIVWLLVIFGLVAFVAYRWYETQLNNSVGGDSRIIFEVLPGESSDVIAENLLQQGLINDKTVLLIYLRLNTSLSSGIQAGLFDLSPSQTIPEIVATLQSSRRADEFKVTIPEGLRLDEIAKIVAISFENAGATNFSEAEYVKIAENPDKINFTSTVATFLDEHKPNGVSLEGFLYPETYFFTKSTTTQEVIERQISTLRQALSADDFNTIKNSKYGLYEILNIASMVEREAFSASESPIIADIIRRRNEDGVEGVRLLQIDATLLYIAKDWKADAFRLKSSESRYNTYKYTGLPPTPISNPGKDAILGSIYPEKNDYWFYIHDLSGKMHLAKTLAEHNANIRKYL